MTTAPSKPDRATVVGNANDPPDTPDTPDTPGERTTVALAIGHNLVRDSLHALLDSRSNLKIVGECSDSRTALQVVADASPNVLIMDLASEGINGVETARHLRHKLPKLKIVFLCHGGEDRLLADALALDTSGFLWHDCAFKELTHAIDVVVAGSRYISPVIANLVVDTFARRQSTSKVRPVVTLTSRQKETLRHLAEGKSTKAIATAMKISPKTVDAHRRELMERLELHNVAALTKYAVREGLTSLDS